MVFQDVAFLPSRASFYIRFLISCGRCEGLGTTKCRKTVVVGKQGHAPCKILLLPQSLFFMSVESHGDHHKTVIKLR